MNKKKFALLFFSLTVASFAQAFDCQVTSSPGLGSYQQTFHSVVSHHSGGGGDEIFEDFTVAKKDFELLAEPADEGISITLSCPPDSVTGEADGMNSATCKFGISDFLKISCKEIL